MEGVDTSVIARAVPTPVNPLDTLGKAQGLQQGALQNKLLGQQVEGKIAMGEAAAAAVNPETGVFDGDKFLKALAANPKGAFQVPEAAAQAVARNLSQMQLDTGQLELSDKRWKKIGEVAAAQLSPGANIDPATGQPRPLTKDGVTSALASDLVRSGMFNTPEARQQLVGFVTSLPDDEGGIRDRLAQLYLQSHATTEGINLVRGAPTTVDTGGSVQIVRPSPLTGEVTPMGGIAKTLAPGEAVRPAYQRYNPVTKQMEQVLTGDAMAAAQGTGGNTAPPAVVAGPALGAAEGASASAQAAAHQLDALRVAAERVPEMNAALQNIGDSLESFTPGPKANLSYAIGALAQQLGLASPKVTEGVAGQEEFNKLATQFINQQVGALGGTGTDSKLESARHGSPNEFMSKVGIKNVKALMMGLNDATAAKNLAAQKWIDAGNGPETYPKFVSQFNQVYNPRVFQSQYMSDKQKASMLGNMDAKARERFEKDWIFAKKAGWIK